MENQKIPKASNFWFGFITGVGIALTGTFLLGTKKGREFLRNVIELSEDFEGNLATIMEDVEEQLKGKEEEIHKEIEKKTDRKEYPSLHHLLNKIKNRLTF